MRPTTRWRSSSSRRFDRCRSPAGSSAGVACVLERGQSPFKVRRTPWSAADPPVGTAGVVGQDGILRAGWQPALDGLFCKRREASYQLAAGCQPCPTTRLAPSLYFASLNRQAAGLTSLLWSPPDEAAPLPIAWLPAR